MRIFTAILLIFWGLTPAFAADQFEEMLVRQAAIDKFVHDAPLFLKDTSLHVLRKLDHLKNESIIDKENPHITGEKLEFRTLTFNGLTIYGRVLNKSELRPIIIRVTDPCWKIFYGLNVGTNSDRIEQKLGTPTKEYSYVKQYCGETECVNFHTKSSEIIEVELIYYED